MARAWKEQCTIDNSPDDLDAMLEDLQVDVIVAPVGHDLVVYERGEHLRLQEAREEGPVPLRLVREERCLVEIHHRFARRQP